MSKVKWIRITVDMFDNRKIKYLRKLPDGNNIVLIWVMLLTMAGRCNSGGMIFLTENIPYTPKMLADELGFEENTVILALQALENLNMIVRDEKIFQIVGWEEHQNADGLEKIREQNRERQARFKAKKRLEALPENSTNGKSNVTDNVTVTQGNATDRDRDIDIESEKENILIDSKKSICQTDIRRVIEKWNELSCFGIKPVCKITATSQRYKMLKARIREYGIGEVLEAVERIKNSNYLQGKVNNWQIDFDWFVKPNNFPKVREGKYDNRSDNTYNTVGDSPRKPAGRFDSMTQEDKTRLVSKGIINLETEDIEYLLASELNELDTLRKYGL